MFQAKVKLVEKVHYRFKDDNNREYDGYKITIDGDGGGYIRFHSDKPVKEGDTINVGIRQYGSTLKCFLAD